MVEVLMTLFVIEKVSYPRPEVTPVNDTMLFLSTTWFTERVNNGLHRLPPLKAAQGQSRFIIW